MKNKREFIIAFVSLLVGVIVTYFFLQNRISNTVIQKSKIKDINTQNGIIIEARTGSFNSNGKIDTIQLKLLSKYDGSGNAKLVLIEDGKEISTKNVTLENDFGNLELVNLFDYSHQQILFTEYVGAHSMNGFFYQVRNGELTPICPDQSEGPNSCYFFSDGPSIYAKDLDGDGVKEIISDNFTYYGDPQANPTIYKWNGSIYKTVTGTQYDKFLAILKAKK